MGNTVFLERLKSFSELFAAGTGGADGDTTDGDDDSDVDVFGDADR